MNKIVYSLYENSEVFKKILHFIFPRNKKLIRLKLYNSYFGQYLYSFYDSESLKNKTFYNVGAGNQRSKFDFWTYLDLEGSKYNKVGVDLFFDLESLNPLPIIDNSAEVVFNSFVIEHISVEATKNLCKEAFRVLKTGGVFHSKVHCYEYAYRLLDNNIISPMFPFYDRDCVVLIDELLDRNKGKVKTFFDKDKQFVIQGKKNVKDQMVFSAYDAFLYHNASAAIGNISNPKETLDAIKSDNFEDFYSKLHKYVDPDLRKPHQHNADYFPKEKLMKFLKELGFSEVYFTQPYQSISPALWEDELNPVHKGFLFSIEAVK
ncbi:MAG: methyltransferase domain-containing protein [Bacteroidales bacterium]|nr:methyltransferase domain-containing protein [Bacteroidales bacterium]